MNTFLIALLIFMLGVGLSTLRAILVTLREIGDELRENR